MSAQFTPGPWAWGPCMDSTGKYRVSYDIYLPVEPEATGAAVIASCFFGEADARLIAAAPALLLELEMTVDLLERASRTLTEECKSALEGRQWGGVRIASARAAIALAKGESA